MQHSHVASPTDLGDDAAILAAPLTAASSDRRSAADAAATPNVAWSVRNGGGVRKHDSYIGDGVVIAPGHAGYAAATHGPRADGVFDPKPSSSATSMDLPHSAYVSVNEPEAVWETSGAERKKLKKLRAAGANSTSATGAVITGTHDDSRAQVDGGASGLGNRYGENNCYLNVVVQSLYHLGSFRGDFLRAWRKDSTNLPASISLAPQHSRERAAVELLRALATLFESMARGSSGAPRVQASPAVGFGAAISTSAERGDSVPSLSQLRRALLDALVARAISASHSKIGTDAAAPTTQSAASAAAATLSSHAMGDASEALEEIIQLLHESEAIVVAITAARKRAAKAGASDAATAAAVASAVAACIAIPPAGGADELAVDADQPLPKNAFFALAELPVPHTVPAAPAWAMHWNRTSSALAAFGLSTRDEIVCSACGSRAVPSYATTGLALHINTYELLSARAVLQHAGDMSPSFASVLHSIVSGSEAIRSCDHCVARAASSAGAAVAAAALTSEADRTTTTTAPPRPPQVLHRVLLSPVSVFTVVLGWATARESPDVRVPVLDAIDGAFDLAQVYELRNPLPAGRGLDRPPRPGDAGSGSAEGITMPARLRGFVCYRDSHWVSFHDDSCVDDATAAPHWVCANDERVFEIDEPPMRVVAKHRLQPSLMFYTPSQIGDPVPLGRGREALHGAASSGSSNNSSIPLSIAAEAGVAALALSDDAAFPSLGGSGSGGTPKATGPRVTSLPVRAPAAAASLTGATAPSPVSASAPPVASSMPSAAPTGAVGSGGTTSAAAPRTAAQVSAAPIHGPKPPQSALPGGDSTSQRSGRHNKPPVKEKGSPASPAARGTMSATEAAKQLTASAVPAAPNAAPTGIRAMSQVSPQRGGGGNTGGGSAKKSR